MMTKLSHRRKVLSGALVVGLAMAGVAAVASEDTDPPGKPLRYTSTPPSIVPAGDVPPPSPEYGPKGRYQTLLRKIEVPKDQESYGDFYDYGYYSGTSYAGFSDLPAGYWVYVNPHWLIYKTAVGTGVAETKVGFSPEQLIGKPDTLEAGDLPTAWASASADGQREWIELTYVGDFEAVGVMVYENHCPGAVDSVIAYVGNEQVQVWAGKDPTEPGKPKGVSVIGFSVPVKTRRVRINIDSPRVSGWNEIDAVGLLDKDGGVHWATGASASSSYGSAQGADAPSIDDLSVPSRRSP